MRAVRRDGAPATPTSSLHSGDTVYADGPLEETVTLPDGTTWRNIVTRPKSKVAETSTSTAGSSPTTCSTCTYRSVHRRGADDRAVGRPRGHQQLVPRRDPGRPRLHRAARRRPGRARLRRRSTSGCRSTRAGPIDGRVYRSSLRPAARRVRARHAQPYAATTGASPGRPRCDARRGPGALARRRARPPRARRGRSSRRTCRSGLVVPDGDRHRGRRERPARGRPPAARHEIARVLPGCAKRRVRNTVWLTADVHYTAAHRYAPERAAVGRLRPVLGVRLRPAHAGASPAGTLDPTFGPSSCSCTPRPRTPRRWTASSTSAR